MNNMWDERGRTVGIDELDDEVHFVGRRFDAAHSEQIGDFGVSKASILVLVQVIEDCPQF
jgi:hypothetical protein